MEAISSVDASAASCSLALLGTFEFRVHGVMVELPKTTQRLVAYLALQARPVSRSRVAAALWPDASEHRSLGSLRSALWRLRIVGRPVIYGDGAQLALAPEAHVDITILGHQTHRLLDSAGADLSPLESELFGLELLPGWDDDWVLFERERLRQLSLLGLEALSRCHLAAGRVLEAIDSAARAISLEPLRESAHSALIEANLAAGNLREAVRSLRSLAAVLDRELGIRPDPALVARVISALDARREVALSIPDF